MSLSCRSGTLQIDDPSTDENRFIALLESERGLHVHRLCAGTPDDWAQLSGNVRQSELPVFDDGACAQAPLLAWAQEVGARTLLTGMWSDQLLFVTGYLTDLAMQLRWRQVARHMRDTRAGFRTPTLPIFGSAFGESCCSTSLHARFESGSGHCTCRCHDRRCDGQSAKHWRSA